MDGLKAVWTVLKRNKDSLLQTAGGPPPVCNMSVSAWDSKSIVGYGRLRFSPRRTGRYSSAATFMFLGADLWHSKLQAVFCSPSRLISKVSDAASSIGTGSFKTFDKNLCYLLSMTGLSVPCCKLLHSGTASCRPTQTVLDLFRVMVLVIIYFPTGQWNPGV